MIMNKDTPVTVYQLGVEIPSLVRPIFKRIVLNTRLRNVLVPEHALIYNGGMYRGRGEHLPERLTLMLGHNYRTRNVEQDFPIIDAALIALGHSDNEAISIAPAHSNERGLEDLAERFNFYREMRDVRPNVQWKAA